MNLDSLGRRHSTTRSAMYNSLASWIETNKPKGKVLLISEGKEHAIKNMFSSGCQFTATQYPQIDIMDLSRFPNASFDIVVTDQVLEHISDPFLANKQIYRILKKGGLVINTSCAFNPIHDPPDYFRFTKDGFREIHRNFHKIHLLESWGNRWAIARFSAFGVKSFDVRKWPWEKLFATNNDEKWPWSVWCIAQK